VEAALSDQAARRPRSEPRFAQGEPRREQARPVRVAIVDDHDVFRGGLATLLAGEDGIEVVGEASTGEEGLELVARLAPDVAVMDLSLPGISGVEATRRLCATAPFTHVLVLSISAEESDITEAVHAGACGYLLKDASIDDIVAGVRAAAGGEAVLSPRVATWLLERLRSASPAPDAVRRGAELTEREIEVLRLLAQGSENREIARALYISPQTAKNHVSSILAKLEVENRIQAAVFAVRAGLV
jgi:DNA-binding NarL/FixJ family response regulator